MVKPRSTTKGERVEFRLTAAEASAFWAHLYAGGHKSKANYAKGAALAGHLAQVEQLNREIGRLGQSLNELISKIDQTDHPPRFFPLIDEIIEVCTVVTDALSKQVRK